MNSPYMLVGFIWIEYLMDDGCAINTGPRRFLSIYLFIIPNPRIEYYGNVTCTWCVSKKDQKTVK